MQRNPSNTVLLLIKLGGHNPHCAHILAKGKDIEKYNPTGYMVPPAGIEPAFHP